MELNTISNRTTWNDAASKINSNFQKIELAFDNIETSGGSAYILTNWDDYSDEIANTHSVSAGLGFDLANNPPIKRVGKHWWIYSARLKTYIDSGVTTGAGNGLTAFINASNSGSFIVTHNLSTYPSVTVVDHSDLVKKEVECEVKYLDESNIEIHWNGALNGFIYIV